MITLTKDEIVDILEDEFKSNGIDYERDKQISLFDLMIGDLDVRYLLIEIDKILGIDWCIEDITYTKENTLVELIETITEVANKKIRHDIVIFLHNTITEIVNDNKRNLNEKHKSNIR